MLRRTALAVLLASTPLAAGAEVLVFAAASLSGALDEALAAWEDETGGEATVSYAGTSALARQIERGAPADLMISASVDWMDWMEARGLVEPETRRDLLSNRLAIVAHGEEPRAAIGPDLDLAGMLGDGPLAMALVDAVPAGVYGREALTSLGLWDDVAGRVVQTDSVRVALALVARGEAPMGVVYATDARAAPGVSVVGLFPEGSHAPILYPAALTDGAAEEAAALLAHLASPRALAVFERHGFVPPG